ncbi:MAG: tetratricopeptide repeat protein, partial [Myxococcales bacterium]
FERALEIEPKHVEANLNLATMLEEDEQNEAALRHYKRALAADPFYADAHVSLALLYEKLGLRRTAREHWRRYLQLDSGGSWADVARRHLVD